MIRTDLAKPRHSPLLTTISIRSRLGALAAVALAVAGCNGAPSADRTVATPASRPAASDGFTITYDPRSKDIVIFGGRIRKRYLDDTWTWDGSTWRASHSAAPSPRAFAAAAPDGNGDVVLFGGVDASGPLSDTWVWHDGWRRANPAHAPTPTQLRALAYDASKNVARLVTGDPAGPFQTWAWDPAAEDWTVEASGPALQAASRGVAMASDPTSGSVVLVTVAADAGPRDVETWVWSKGGWNRLPATPSPVGFSIALAYTSAGPLLVADGLTWRWSGGAWTPAPAARTMPKGEFAAMAGDPQIGGGSGALYVVNDPVHKTADDFWLWTGSNWLQLG